MANYTLEGVTGLLLAAGMPAGPAPLLAGIAMYESGGGNPCAQYPSGNNCSPEAGSNACGLFQFDPCPGPQAANPQWAAQHAVSYFNQSGLQPWTGDPVWQLWVNAGSPQWPSMATVQSWVEQSGVNPSPAGGISTASKVGKGSGTSGSSANPLADVVSFILGGLTPQEVVIRFLEVVGGALVFGAGLVVLLLTVFSKPAGAVSGKAGQAAGMATTIKSLASKGATVAAVAAV